MKNGSGGASAPNAGGSSLAITERQKPAPSCVAALFQMFARRKLFSSSSKKNKLLPSGKIATKLHCPLLRANHLYPPSGQLCESAAVRQPLHIRCFSARTEVLAWETGERRREDGGGQDEAPFGTAKFPLSFSSSDFFGGMKLQFCIGVLVLKL